MRRWCIWRGENRSPPFLLWTVRISRPTGSKANVSSECCRADVDRLGREPGCLFDLRHAGEGNVAVSDPQRQRLRALGGRDSFTLRRYSHGVAVRRNTPIRKIGSRSVKIPPCQVLARKTGPAPVSRGCGKRAEAATPSA